MATRPVITIDGPSGAGKSTVARLVADELDFQRLNTGLLYRAVAFSAQSAGLNLNDQKAIESHAESLALDYDTSGRLTLAQVPLNEAQLRNPAVSRGASIVSAYARVRSALVPVQRQAAKEGGVIAEGRDMGTTIFPDAEVKIFLTASPEARAERRAKELKQKGNKNNDFKDILDSMKDRDTRDERRQVAPLIPAKDALRIDATHLNASQVAYQILTYVRKRIPSLQNPS